MKLLVISDSHGNIANLKHVMGFAKKIKVAAVLHAGDWDTIESVEVVLSFEIPLYTVLGNADIHEDVIQKLKVKSEKFDEDFLEFELGGRKIGVVHKIKNLELGISDLDIIFTGHYHSKDDRTINGIRVVRPGAIIKGNNFAIYNVVETHDTASDKIEFIEDDQV